MHYNNGWKHVAEHLGGRIEKDYVDRLIKIPFWEQFAQLADMGEEGENGIKDQVSAKSDLSPRHREYIFYSSLMQATQLWHRLSFMLAVAGIEASKADARAAVETHNDTGHLTVVPIR